MSLGWPESSFGLFRYVEAVRAYSKPEKFVCVCVCVCVREREREREREVERCFGKGMDGIKSLQNPLIF